MTEIFSRFFARVSRELGQTFRSLKNSAYRTYAIGHFVSMTGSQLQAVALAWTTYALTQSATKLGITAMATYMPAFFLGMVGGLIADRFNRRHVLMATQAVGFVLTAALAVLCLSGYLTFGLILVFALAQGLVNAVEHPCRQAFVFDVVGSDYAVNAVGLNSMIFNSTRLLGPALAALLLPLVGDAACFGLNAISFLVAVLTLWLIRNAVSARKSEAGEKPSLLSGIKLAWRTASIRNVLLLTASTSFFAFQYAIMLPVMVDKVLHGSALELSLVTAAAALGSLVGNLVLASRAKKESLPRIIAWSSIAPGVFLLFFAMSTSFWLMLIASALLGGSIALQLGGSNSFLQLTVPSDFRGRVMSMYTSVLIGSVPFGSLLVGQMADSMGAPRALALCAFATLAASGLYLLSSFRRK